MVIILLSNDGVKQLKLYINQVTKILLDSITIGYADIFHQYVFKYT